MVKVNIHQHQKGKPNLSKKIFGPEATLIQCKVHSETFNIYEINQNMNCEASRKINI